MFTYCTQLEVSCDDLLPQKICCDCVGNLTSAFEFKRLCHQSDASFRQMLLQNQTVQPMPAETDPDIVLTPVEVHETLSEGCPQGMTTYHCCFKRCDQRTTDYNKLRDHAKKNHQTRRHGNAKRRRDEHRFVCAICMGGFSNRTEWNMHRALLQGVHRSFECTRCGQSFHEEDKLVVHMALKQCRKQAEGEEDGNKETDHREGEFPFLAYYTNERLGYMYCAPPSERHASESKIIAFWLSGY